MKVTIIIPVYNIEKYLPRCIKSVEDQTYKNIEIILIDDGSTDNSGELCDEYVKKDSRIRVLHRENKGVSSARNTGMEMATGDAILFLDSDDYMAVDCISKMVSLMKKYNADISILQMKYIPEYMNEELQCNKEIVKVMDSKEAIEESLYQKKYTCCAPSKLYSKKVIQNVQFPVGRIAEDLATCHLFFDNANKIVYSNYYGYYYRQHRTSAMHVFNQRRLDALEVANGVEVFCKEKYPSIIRAAYCRTFNVATHLLLDLPKDGEIRDMYYEKIWSEIKRTRKKVFFDLKARNREKAAVILSFGGEKLMKRIWNSKLAIRKD